MAVVILLPFAWLLISSISPPTDLLSVARALVADPPDAGALPGHLHLPAAGGDNVAANFRLAMVNSLIVATLHDGDLARSSGRSAATRSPGCGSGCAVRRCSPSSPSTCCRRSRWSSRSTWRWPTCTCSTRKIGLIITYCSIVTPFCLWTMSNYYLQPARRPGGGRPGRRLLAARRPVAGHPAAGPARPADHGDVRLPAGLGRVPLRPDLHLDDQRQDHPGGDRRVHRQVLLRLRPHRRRRRPRHRSHPCSSRCSSSATSSEA